MILNSSLKVVVGMSGGVDSSVAALLLTQAGYDVTGIMLRLWTEPGNEDRNSCCTPDSIAAARKVAAIIGIPFYVVDVRDLFHREIVGYFIRGYELGETPNPCIRCNQVIRWGALLEEAENIGADFLATGHYARLDENIDGSISLRKGQDQGKDQSYVLSGVSQSKLRKTLLPIGNLLKSAVREIARSNNLPTAEKQDSQDLCFLAGEDYREFLKRNAPEILMPGPILNIQGEIIGQHSGLPNYTIGQRKGLGAIQEPYYVLKKDTDTNSLWIGKNEEMGSDTCLVEEINWITPPAKIFPQKMDVKIRYKAPPVAAEISSGEKSALWVKFDKKLRDITPGQQAAFYFEDLCLGGGKITRVTNE
ncbi:MAG: tRNA 2-thiouridine(34) synthase MnmA [Leptolinea sp.]